MGSYLTVELSHCDRVAGCEVNMQTVLCAICGKRAGEASPDIQNMCVVVHTQCLAATNGEVRPDWLFRAGRD